METAGGRAGKYTANRQIHITTRTQRNKNTMSELGRVHASFLAFQSSFSSWVGAAGAMVGISFIGHGASGFRWHVVLLFANTPSH
jgi:hypothetical protein